MPIVINLGQEITATKIKDTAKEIVVAEHRHYNGKKDILTDTETLNDVFARLVQDMPEMQNEKICVNLSYGSGIQYRTSSVAADTIVITDKKMKYEEKESRILDTCREYLPSGLTSRYKNWESCVMEAYEGDTDIIVSCCYIPTDFLENLKKVIALFELDVLQITSHAYGLYKILDPQERQLIFEIPTGWLAINQFGMACWPRPEVCALTKEQIINDLSGTTERLFKINPEVMNLVLTDDELIEHLKKPVKYTGILDAFILAAAGCVLHKIPKPQADTENENAGKGGKFSELTSKLRQLFAKKGK